MPPGHLHGVHRDAFSVAESAEFLARRGDRVDLDTGLLHVTCLPAATPKRHSHGHDMHRWIGPLFKVGACFTSIGSLTPAPHPNLGLVLDALVENETAQFQDIVAKLL